MEEKKEMINEAFNVDCMVAMRSFMDNHFDLAIVDPPYGINAEQGTNLQVRTKFKDKKYGWDSSPPHEDYFTELIRVSKSQIIWGANHFRFPPSANVIIWDKGITCRSRAFSDGELAWVSPNVSGFGISGLRIFDGKQGGVADNKNGTTERIHPTQKPIGLYEWMLMKYATCKSCQNTGSYHEDVAGDGGSQMEMTCEECNCHERPVRILDTHLGSGSSRIAAYKLGYDFTGFEIDKEYFDASEKRFKEVTSQLTMF